MHNYETSYVPCMSKSLNNVIKDSECPSYKMILGAKVISKITPRCFTVKFQYSRALGNHWIVN